jgi:hypothetical protein
MIDKLTKAIVSIALTLAAGVDTGSGKMEGVYAVHNSAMKFSQNFEMVDWNNLLETEEQVGPIPLCCTARITRKSCFQSLKTEIR